MSWDEIERFYRDLISHQWQVDDIIPLIQFIRDNNDLNQRLFGCTSLDRLIVSIYNPIELQREALWIEFDKERKLWNFKYYPHPFHEPEHERYYPGELLIEKFQSFVDKLKWI